VGCYYEIINTDERQGGIFTPQQVEIARQDPWLEEKLAVRRFDDLAKDPSLKVEPLSFYEDMAIKSLVGESFNIFQIECSTD
jgi:predicted HD phosphohydrolase